MSPLLAVLYHCINGSITPVHRSAAGVTAIRQQGGRFLAKNTCSTEEDIALQSETYTHTQPRFFLIK